MTDLALWLQTCMASGCCAEARRSQPTCASETSEKLELTNEDFFWHL